MDNDAVFVLEKYSFWQDCFGNEQKINKYNYSCNNCNDTETDDSDCSSCGEELGDDED